MKSEMREALIMKFILKLLFAPIIFVLWLITGICTLLVRVSATVLFFVAILFIVARLSRQKSRYI